MSHDFYGANLPTLWEFFGPILLHVVLLLAGIVAIAGLTLRRRRPAQMYDTFLWFACGIVITVVFLSLVVGQRDVEKFVVGFVAFVWAITVAGMSVSLYRLWTGRNSSDIAVTVGSLAFLCLLLPCLMPATPSAREAARRTQCKNHLKQIGLALHNYENVWNSFPHQRIGEPPQSWRVAILPYVDSAPIYNEYRHDKPWDSPENERFSKLQLNVYQCPSQKHTRNDQDRFLTSYALMYGPQGIWREDRQPLQLGKITDGTSNTITVMEACGQNIVWNEPRDLDGTTTPAAVNLRGAQRHESPAMASSLHVGGAHVLMADGSVRFISQNIAPQTLQALVTADGGEILGDY